VAASVRYLSPPEHPGLMTGILATDPLLLENHRLPLLIRHAAPQLEPFSPGSSYLSE